MVMAMGTHLATKAVTENCWVQPTNLIDAMNLMNIFFLKLHNFENFVC